MTDSAGSDQAWCAVAHDGTRDYLRVSVHGATYMAHWMPRCGALTGDTPIIAVMNVVLLFGLGNHRLLGPGVVFDRDGEELCAQCDGSGYDIDVRLAGHDGACSVCYGHGRSSDEVPR